MNALFKSKVTFCCYFFFVNFSKDISPEAKAIALKITSFVEAQDIDFELAVDAKSHGPILP